MRSCAVVVVLLLLSMPASASGLTDWLIDAIDAGIDVYTFYSLYRAADFDDPVTRGFAASLVTRANSGPYNIGQVCDVFEGIHARWVYVSDPYALFLDNIVRASDTVSANLRGDCDDHAVLMAASIRAIGGIAMIAVDRTVTVGHAYAVVFIGTTMTQAQPSIDYLCGRYNITGVHLWTNSRGLWLNMDWTADRPGGAFLLDANAVVETFLIPVFNLALLNTSVTLPSPAIP